MSSDIAMPKRERQSSKEILSEENVEWNELMRAEGFSKSPSTPREFEKLIVGSPNSSIIWIEYIAEHSPGSECHRQSLERDGSERGQGAIEYLDCLDEFGGFVRQ